MTTTLAVVFTAVLLILVVFILITVFGGTASKFGQGAQESTETSSFKSVCTVKCTACCMSHDTAYCSQEKNVNFTIGETEKGCECQC